MPVDLTRVRLALAPPAGPEPPLATLEAPAATRQPPLALRVYGVAAIAFGGAGLRWSNLAPTWRLVASGSPHRAAWAIAIASLVLAGGLAVQLRRTMGAGLLLLAIAYGAAASTWLERFATGSRSIGYWLPLAEALALFIAAIAAYDTAYRATRARGTGETLRHRALTFVFGACAVTFGISHFAALTFTAAMVPAWIPPGGRFWAVVTAVCHIAAGLAIATDVLSLLAARLLTVMIPGFGALLWLPALVANPHSFGNWANNADNLAIAGAAWIIADMLRHLQRRATS